MLLPLLVMLSAIPGQAVYLEVPGELQLEAVAIDFKGQKLALASSDDGWFGLIGVDLDVAPGLYPVTVSYNPADDEPYTEVIDIDVMVKEYPTTKLEVAPKYVELSAENQQRAAADRKLINEAYSNTSPEPYWQGVFLIPVNGVAGGRNFGHRRVFNDQPRAPHSGADLTAATGTEIMASNAGKVVLTGDFFFNGLAVFVDHGMGVLTMYLHLSEISVSTGQMLRKGEVIGLAGATGRVTGPHLHWGARVGGARVDPFSLPGIPAEEVLSP